MKDVKRRLIKLEQRVLDPNGLVPGSDAWRTHWYREITEYANEDPQARRPRPLFPLDAFRDFMRNAPDTD